MAEVRSGSFKTSNYSGAEDSPSHYVFSWTLTSQSIEKNINDLNGQHIFFLDSRTGCSSLQATHLAALADLVVVKEREVTYFARKS